MGQRYILTNSGLTPAFGGKTKETMSTEFKGTKGFFTYKKGNRNKGEFDNLIYRDKELLIKWTNSGCYSPKLSKIESQENGKLLVDALNTIQSCGLLPSELLKQRDELRDFLRIIISSEMTPISYRKTAKKLLESTDV